MKYIESTAWVAQDGKYRYELTRIWDKSLPVITWVMLNPSTANADNDDATIRKCVGFSKRWGYGGIHVVNLFALRATDPKRLFITPDPIGIDNVMALSKAFFSNYDTVVAWGNNIGFPNRDVQAILSLIEVQATSPHRRFWCLGLTKEGEPRHPLRLAYKTKRIPWKGA